jgi:hypothetical protein
MDYSRWNSHDWNDGGILVGVDSLPVVYILLDHYADCGYRNLPVHVKQAKG